MSQRCLCCRRQRVGWETSEKLCAQDFLLGVALRFPRPHSIHQLRAWQHCLIPSSCQSVSKSCFCVFSQNCGVFVVVVKHWLCQPCCDGSAQCECWHDQQALLVHTGVILPCSCLGQGLDGEFRLEGLGNVLRFVPPL